jgi:hypothetical protein
VSGDERPVRGDERPVSGDERFVSGDERPVSGDEHPVSGDERPVSGDERPVSGDERLVTGAERVTHGDEREEDTLAALQARFAEAITSTRLPFDPALAGDIVPGGSLTLEGAFEVYRGGYLARLTEQLGETFATVWRVLGDEDFFGLCERYIAAHRSDSYNLSDYGRDVPTFLEGEQNVREFSFLPDLARLELAFHDLFHAPQHRSLEAAELAATPDLASSRLRFGDAVRMLGFESRVYRLFQHRGDEKAPDLSGLDAPEHVLLFKQAGEVRARVVDAATAEAIGALVAGATVEESLEQVTTSHPDFGTQRVGELFTILGLCGLVTAVER